MVATTTESGFDGAAAVTRSMLGWGVVAGPFYVIFGLILALTRPGFDLTRDALSLLLLGELGWLQVLNLVLTGIMTIVAAVGLWRTPDWSRGAAVLVGVYGLCLVLSALFRPDPTGSFPPGVSGGVVTVSGLVHLVCGGVGFVCLGAAAIIAGSWYHQRSAGAIWSRLAGIVVIATFVAGGALSSAAAGVALLWASVVVGLAWLAVTSVIAYRTIPHPLLARR